MLMKECKDHVEFHELYPVTVLGLNRVSEMSKVMGCPDRLIMAYGTIRQRRYPTKEVIVNSGPYT